MIDLLINALEVVIDWPKWNLDSMCGFHIHKNTISVLILIDYITTTTTKKLQILFTQNIDITVKLV